MPLTFLDDYMISRIPSGDIPNVIQNLVLDGIESSRGSAIPNAGRIDHTALSALPKGSLHCTKEEREMSVTLLTKPQIASPPAPVNPFPIFSETDKAHIGDLLKVFDEASIPSLGVKMFRLAKIGDQIGHLHPFTFLQIILTDPVLKMRLKRIYNSTFKRLGMMNQNFLREGFGNILDREKSRGTLEPYINAFAISLHVPAEEIRPLIRAGAWTDLCCYLLEKTSLP